MAFTMNRVILIGNVGKDPEIKTFSNGGKVMNFSMATTQSKKDGNSWKEETTWHNIQLNSPNSYEEMNLKRGTNIVVEGRLSTREYEKDGKKTIFYYIRAEEIILNIPKAKGQMSNSPSDNSQVSETVTNYAAAPQSFGDEDVPF